MVQWWTQDIRGDVGKGYFNSLYRSAVAQKNNPNSSDACLKQVILNFFIDHFVWPWLYSERERSFFERIDSFVDFAGKDQNNLNTA